MRNPDTDATTVAVRLRNARELERLRKINAALRWRLEQQDERDAIVQREEAQYGQP